MSEMHKTTVMIPFDQRDYIEQYCFEHGLSFAAWVRQQIALQRRQQRDDELVKHGYSNIQIGDGQAPRRV